MPQVIYLLLALAALATVTSSSLRVDPNTNYLVDQHNRIRVFHGVNSVYKEFPYHPTRDGFDGNGSLVAEDFANLKRWGFNSIRLYMAWQGFEPVRHEYNYTYLSVLKQIVREAETYGITIMIDAHHDLYSKKFCGQGFPLWLGEVSSFPAPWKVSLRYDDQGLPLKEDCMKQVFQNYYTSYDVVAFSQDFFKNKDGMLDKFIEMWLKVVDYFRDEPNVIGYDILNEPAAGNLWFNPYSYIGPNQQNNRLLLPFYKKISQEIRKIQKQKLLFFQVAPQDLIGSFYHPISNSSRDVFNYHTYCPFTKKLGKKKCDYFNFLYTRNRHRQYHRLGMGSVMSEFGSVPNTPEGRSDIESVLEETDKHLTSWYYWQFKYNKDSTCSTNPPWLHAFYYPNGTLQLEKVKTLAYSYAYAICGKFLEQRHQPGSYSLDWYPADCGEKYTQIFLNLQFDFPDGFVLKFVPDCPSCRLRMISKGYYAVLVEESHIGWKFGLRVGAKMQQDGFEE